VARVFPAREGAFYQPCAKAIGFSWEFHYEPLFDAWEYPDPLGRNPPTRTRPHVAGMIDDAVRALRGEQDKLHESLEAEMEVRPPSRVDWWWLPRGCTI
jgi:hypothetical protein